LNEIDGDFWCYCRERFFVVEIESSGNRFASNIHNQAIRIRQKDGLRFINFIHDHLGTVVLQGLDKLLVYNIVYELKAFYKKYGLSIGGGRATAEEKKKFQTKEVAQLVREIKDV
jgi:hypothetical protein